MGDLVRLEVADGIGTIRLDRPKMNPIDDQVSAQLREVALEASARKDVRAVVIYGGERVFAAGADIKQMQTMSYTDMVDYARTLQDTFIVVSRIPKPTVAAITGYALGAGCELALCADFRVVGADAKLGQPEVLLGLIPGAGGSQRLPRLIGPAKAKDLIFTGRMVDAQEALALGMVDEVVEPERVYEAACERMARYTTGPAYALRHAKEAIDRGLEVDLDTGLAIESALFAGCFATEDAKIGTTSFAEQGPGKAAFVGR